MQKFTARAHTNIALMKYWGKSDESLIIPTTSSISLTLNEFFTDTTVQFDEKLDHDDISLNTEPLSGKAAQKVHDFLNLIRERANINVFAHVDSVNHVPTAAGLASSASAFAALAGAGAAAAGLSLSKTELSRLARRGSGSASRSVFGGFVEWHRGSDDSSSFAEPLFETVDWPIQLLTVVINDQPKKIDSRGGMQHTKATSPFYQDWVSLSDENLPKMRAGLASHDLETIGEIAEQNALQMHALNTTATPPFNYLTDVTWEVLDTVHELRAKGIPVYATMDAGPNVKLISRPVDTQLITDALRNMSANVQITVATPGPGMTVQEGAFIS